MRIRSKTKSIPEGFHTLTPYLTVHNAAQAIDFYKRAFGANERFRLPMFDGKIGHAEMTLGDSIFMLSDECPEHGNEAPHASQGAPVGLALYVHDVDAAFDKAVEAGASVKEPVEDKFWGDRAGTVTDPFGHKWTLLTHVEEVSAEEIKKRMHEACAETAAKA